MDVSLISELEKLVESRLQSRGYDSAIEVGLERPRRVDGYGPFLEVRIEDARRKDQPGIDPA